MVAEMWASLHLHAAMHSTWAHYRTPVQQKSEGGKDGIVTFKGYFFNIRRFYFIIWEKHTKYISYSNPPTEVIRHMTEFVRLFFQLLFIELVVEETAMSKIS